MATHAAVATTAKGVIDTLQLPTEEPGHGEVLLKVEYAAMTPPDAYMADRGFYVPLYPLVLGLTAAGVVQKVGSGVDDLKTGDRVTTFAYGPSRQKGVQEYCIQPRTVCAKIPGGLSFEDAATIPDNFVCAFYTIFNQLSLPMPSTFPASVDPPLSNTTILIYGAGSTAGQYMIRLLHLAKYHRVFATASPKHHQHLRSLGATDLFDYNSPSLTGDIAKAAGGDGKILMAVDCISSQSTLGILADIVSPLGTVALLMPIKEGTTLNNRPEDKLISDMPIPEYLNPFPKGTKIIGVKTFYYHEDQVLKERLLPVILPELLENGLIQPTRLRVMDQGSLQRRVEQALDLFRNNRVSGEKLVIKLS